MRKRAYAYKTRVPIATTRAQIEQLVQAAGATQFAVAWDSTSRHVRIEFSLGDRRIRFELTVAASLTDQQGRARWRALLLAIKAKLETVAAGVETFDEAFLSHVVLRDGRTFGEVAIPQIEYQQ